MVVQTTLKDFDLYIFFYNVDATNFWLNAFQFGQLLWMHPIT